MSRAALQGAGCVDHLQQKCGLSKPLFVCSGLKYKKPSSHFNGRFSSSAACQGHLSKKTVQDKCVRSEVLREEATPLKIKKNVAIWVGYVGTDYKGLQIQRGVDGVQSVENQLEEAIYKAGGISDKNYKHLEKVRWKRSSRTDKGVHSLCTVITMRLEVPMNAWLNDIDGIEIAENVNAYLPQNIRIFGVVPVTKSFNARMSCYSRSYDYFLPAGCLAIESASSAEEGEQRIEAFRSILKLFEGRKAFHNYTVRSIYRRSQRGWGYKQAAREVKDKTKFEHTEKQVMSVSESDELDTSEEDRIDEQDSESLLETQIPRRRAYLVDHSNLVDVVKASHYRRVTECTCGGLEKLGDASVIRVSITGDSFMLHQIRKMVGTAIAVFRNVLPEDTIPISMARYARIVLPIAPSEGLVLSSNAFLPFKGGYVRDRKGSGHFFSRAGIQMSEQITGRINSFWMESLVPLMATTMDKSRPPWDKWLQTLQFNRIEDAEFGVVRDSWKQWQETISQENSL